MVDLRRAGLLRRGLSGEGLLSAGFLSEGLEREVILFETCVQPNVLRRQNEGGTARLKRALIGIGDSAPIRDR
jgi:hypothetical protein